MTSPLYDEVAALRQRWRDEVGAALPAYLMVDPAPLYRRDIDVPALGPSCRGASVVDDDLIEAPEVKPFLVDLNAPGSGDALTWWCEQADTINGLSLLVSRMSLYALSCALRTRMAVVLKPAAKASLRLYDTRVAPVVHEVLHPHQRATLYEGIDHWAYTGRDGQFCSLALPGTAPGSTAGPLPIELEATQVDALLQASRADQVLNRLGNAREVLAEGRSATQTHALVRELVQRAQGHGLDGLPEWIAFCVAWVRCGPRFDERSPWRERLEMHRRDEISLAEALHEEEGGMKRANDKVLQANVRCWLSMLALVGLSACHGPKGITAESLGMHGYNYTDLPIASYSVSGAGWGGDVRVSSERGGGGGTTCCASVPEHLPARYLVRWSRDRDRWCEIEVDYRGPIPPDPRFLDTHFFQDGHVEITISHEYTNLLVKLPNVGAGLSRKATGNVTNDERFARCKDAI